MSEQEPQGAGGSGGPAVAGYVAAVRAELADLGSEVVEELTGGLEADLADALAGDADAFAGDADALTGDADGRSPAERFGTPAAYAAELRSAAGLSPRAVGGGRREAGLSARSLRESRDRLLAPLLRQPWWPQTAAYVVSLRPAWWLIRAYLAMHLLVRLFTSDRGLMPPDLAWWLLLLLFTVVSVMLGQRGLAQRYPVPQALIGLGNGFAVLVMLGFLWSSSSSVERVEYQVSSSPTGLQNEGYPVANVFPYDKDGRPLHDVQLYDDRGQPLKVSGQNFDRENGQSVELIPSMDTSGQQRWNVFPLRERVTQPGVDQSGNPLPQPTTGALLEAPLPDPSQRALVPLPSPTTASPSASSSGTPPPSASSSGTASPSTPSPSTPSPSTPSAAPTSRG